MKTKLVTLLLCLVALVIQGFSEERVNVPPSEQTAESTEKKAGVLENQRENLALPGFHSRR